SVDKTTGELALKLEGLSVPNLAITTDGVGGVCGFISDITSAVLSFLNSLPGFIKQFVIDLLTPALDNLVQSFLPKPLGLAGVLDWGSLLASFSPPKDTNLETFIVPGGYVGSSAGGLTLGVMSGMNSDRDESTRAPGMASEPSLCVPSRDTP